MDTFIPIQDAARITHMTPGELERLAQAGKIKAAMLAGCIILSTHDLPIRKEDSEEYQAVAHLRGVSIGVRQAAEKYNVASATISRWVERGLIRRVSGEVVRGQRVLIDEADVAYCVALYNQDPGRGKKTLK
jgi:hypothetical protein